MIICLTSITVVSSAPDTGTMTIQKPYILNTLFIPYGVGTPLHPFGLVVTTEVY